MTYRLFFDNGGGHPLPPVIIAYIFTFFETNSLLSSLATLSSKLSIFFSNYSCVGFDVAATCCCSLLIGLVIFFRFENVLLEMLA